MKTSVLIDYTLASQQQSVAIPLNYEVAMFDNIRTISCVVVQHTEHAIPGWLRPFKFDIKSIARDGEYETLYSDYATVMNLDAALFIDKASDIILQMEADTAAAAPRVKAKRKA